MMTFKVKTMMMSRKYNLGWWVSDNGKDEEFKAIQLSEILQFSWGKFSSWNKKCLCYVKEDWVTLMACKNENRFLSSGNNDSSRHLLFPSWHWERILVKTVFLVIIWIRKKRERKTKRMIIFKGDGTNEDFKIYSPCLHACNIQILHTLYQLIIL